MFFLGLKRDEEDITDYPLVDGNNRDRAFQQIENYYNEDSDEISHIEYDEEDPEFSFENTRNPPKRRKPQRKRKQLECQDDFECYNLQYCAKDVGKCFDLGDAGYKESCRRDGGTIVL